MLTNEEIHSAVESAFPPYRCVAKVWDYGQRLKFTIFDANDVRLLTMEELVLSSVRDITSLESLLFSVRLRLDEKIKHNPIHD